jgi:hypothetical protein
MNQALLHAEILLRHQARERDNHIEEGRVLRALHAPAAGRTSGRQTSSAGSFAEPTGVRSRISWLWRGARFPSLPGAPRPLHTDSPLLQAAD